MDAASRLGPSLEYGSLLPVPIEMVRQADWLFFADTKTSVNELMVGQGPAGYLFDKDENGYRRTIPHTAE